MRYAVITVAQLFAGCTQAEIAQDLHIILPGLFFKIFAEGCDPEKDLDGIPINNGCTNVFINAKQFARWGWLFLNQGNWDGQQLISREWVKMATSVQVPASLPMGDTDRRATVGPGCYGFNWWVNGQKADGSKKLPGAPEGVFFPSGLNNNKCLVIPGWNMVIVRMGEDGHPDNPDRVYGTFLKMMGEAVLK